MIISIEGPEKAGKTTLVERTLANFEPDKSQLIKCSGRDAQNGLGYLPEFLSGLDSDSIQVWDRAWIGEAIYGELLQDGRAFADDPFMGEWIYGRALAGRGGKFILLPEDPKRLRSLRDKTDLPVSPIAEYSLFRDYAEEWGYEILWNDYTETGLAANSLKTRRSPFVGVHKVDSRLYIGSHNPIYTFVGESSQQWDFSHRPFMNQWAAEYFRAFGDSAILDFGYASLKGCQELQDAEPNLFKRIITVGSEAGRSFKAYPNVHYKMESVEKEDIVGFLVDMALAIKDYL